MSHRLRAERNDPTRRRRYVATNDDRNKLMSKPRTLAFVSLGCPKNLVDSERMLGRLTQDGYALVPEADGADVLEAGGLEDSARFLAHAPAGDIGKEVAGLLDNQEFVNALPGHIAGDEISQARIPMILRTLNSLRGIGARLSPPRQSRTTSRKGRKKPMR